MIAGDTGKDVVVLIGPGFGDERVFDPKGMLARGRWEFDLCILNVLVRMRNGACESEAGLIENDVLEGGAGMDEVGGLSEMVELALRQGNDDAGEGVDIRV